MTDDDARRMREQLELLLDRDRLCAHGRRSAPRGGCSLECMIQRETDEMHAAMDRKERELDQHGYGYGRAAAAGMITGLEVPHAERLKEPHPSPDSLDTARASGEGLIQRPPREDYVRVTREACGFTLEPAIEYRDGDDFHALAYALTSIAITAGYQRLEDHMFCARWAAERIAERWPDRAYFVEVWQEGSEGFAQVFQPFGVPRNR